MGLDPAEISGSNSDSRDTQKHRHPTDTPAKEQLHDTVADAQTRTFAQKRTYTLMCQTPEAHVPDVHAGQSPGENAQTGAPWSEPPSKPRAPAARRPRLRARAQTRTRLR